MALDIDEQTCNHSTWDGEFKAIGYTGQPGLCETLS